MPVDAEKNKLQNCHLGFLNFENFENFGIFSTFFYYFFKKSPQISKFSKTGIYVLEETLKNVCTKFQVIPFINAVFIALWMWKNGYFSGRNTMHFHIFILFRFLCNKRCSKVIFRVRIEKPTRKHVLRRQMTEIGNLTSWPQMTLTSEKVTSG